MLWAGMATLCVLLPGQPPAYTLARSQFRGRRLVSTLISLPLVLPPTAAGFLLLKVLADNGLLGREHFI